MDNNKPPSLQTTGRRLLLVLAVVIGVLIYAYGWRVTDISLEETQDPTRQESVTRALRELLSPDIFDQDRASEFTEVPFWVGCGDNVELPEPAATDGPYITLGASCGEDGDLIAVEGFNFKPDADAFLRWIPPTGQVRPLVRRDIDDDGYFSTVIEVPRIRGSDDEPHIIQAEGSWPVGLPFLSDTSLTVLEKIIETIFLALMATTIAVPIAVVLSFFAARNLMRQIQWPIGEALIGFILLPVGWVLGVTLLGPVGHWALTLGRGLFLGMIGAAVAIIVYGVIAQALNRLELSYGSMAYHGRRLLLRVLMITALVFVVGALGGIGLWAGDILQDSFLADLGNMVGTLGQLIELTVVFIAGISAAFLVSSLGMELTRDWFKTVRGTLSVVLGGVLGALAGVVLFFILSAIANLAALLSLLLPIIAAIFGAQIGTLVYNRVMGTGGIGDNDWHKSARSLVAVVSAVAIFTFVLLYLDIGRGLVDGRLPSSLTMSIFGSEIQIFTVQSMAIGLVLGGVAGLLASARAVFPMGMVLYNTSRTLLNAIRAIEPLIMGIVFVIWVGVGPFAGVLALTLHSVAALGKLYSEQVENIDEGPLEAVQATGANRVQTIIYAVVPQIVPPYIAFTMYRWDINVRMSTIIGFVGGGGIGFLLQQQINLLRYRDAGVAVLAIAIVVSVLDYTSAYIRERVV
ncbi:ABC transporter permease subunit [Chloroflexota bacterium]